LLSIYGKVETQEVACQEVLQVECNIEASPNVARRPEGFISGRPEANS
jgi:hypothetical protein